MGQKEHDEYWTRERMIDLLSYAERVLAEQLQDPRCSFEALLTQCTINALRRRLNG